MRTIRLALLASLVLSGPLAVRVRAEEPPPRRRVTARVDPRVELMGIVFRLAGNPEYGRTLVPSYAAAVDGHFVKWKDHAVVRRAAALRRDHFVSFDAVMSMAIHLDDAYRLRGKPEEAERLDARWPRAEVPAFLEDLRAFAKDSDAAGFFRSQTEFFAKTTGRLQKVLDAGLRLAWFDSFFGARPSATFELAVFPLSGGGSYGPSVRRPDGTEELHSILGVWAVDADGNADFGGDVVPIVVHEFCHSYCNALADARWRDFEKAAVEVWPLVAEGMASQAYSNPQTMMRETFVRACVVRYRATIEGKDAARAEVEAQRERSFPWIEDLSTALERYEADRARWPTLESFAPEIAKAFSEAVARLVAAAAAAPKVVAMVPANGAKDVDPALPSIVVTFDRPMRDRAWAVVGGGPKFPKLLGSPSYDSARRVLTIPVQLEPGHAYEFWLNRGKYDSFRSEDGLKLASVHVTFETRAR